MKFFPNDIRAIVSTDENGNFSQERADAFKEFMNEERRIARADGWTKAINAVSALFRGDKDIASKISERGHSSNHFAQD